MASNLTVKVHPVVYMSIVDAYERKSSANIGRAVTTRATERGESRALGTLLGFYEKNVVQVTNCYAIPFRETSEDLPEINDIFNKQMWQMAKRTSPSEQIVGWFFTVPDLSDTCPYYHAYYTGLAKGEQTKKEAPPVILLTMDMSFAGECAERLPIKAFTARDAGIPGKGSQATIFYPLTVALDMFPGESVALDFVTKGLESERREIEFTSGQQQLLGCSEQLIEWLEKVLAYMKKVVAGKEPVDPAIGRKLMEIVSVANTQLDGDKLHNLVKHSLRDYLMVSLLANLAKTQLALQEKITST